MSSLLTRSRGTAAPVNPPALPARTARSRGVPVASTPALAGGGGRGRARGRSNIPASTVALPTLSEQAVTLEAPIPPQLAGQALIQDPVSEVSPQITSFINQAISDGLAALQATREREQPPPAAPGYQFPTPSLNLGASFSRVATTTTPAPPIFGGALFSPFYGGTPSTMTPVLGGGGASLGHWDRSKTLKSYKEKLEGHKLLWSLTTPITKLNEAFKLIGPIIMRDARTLGDSRLQMDWTWSAFQELTPTLMWEAFTLNAQEDILRVTTLDDLLQLLAQHLFKHHLNPESARRQFESFSFEYRTTYLQSMAMELLSLAKTSFVSGILYVDKVIAMSAKCPVGNTIRDFWKVGEGATYIARMGRQAFMADPVSLDALGRQMLQFLERVQSLLPALVDKVEKVNPITPTDVIGALNGGNRRFPCKNCDATSHGWQRCPLPYKLDFPRCTYAVCVSRNKSLGHTLDQCFQAHPELLRERQVRKEGRDATPGSPSKKARFAPEGEEAEAKEEQ